MPNLNRNQIFNLTQDIVREYLQHPLCEISGKSWSKERLEKRYTAYSEMLELYRQAQAIEKQYSVTKMDAIVLFPDSHSKDDAKAIDEWSRLTKAAMEIWATGF
ncbi:hypothetical protein OTK49_28465 [Vibrio coralliirubri]|uniref:hypothetical protein n=1 Tax=Vibrio coralliirubri TaxID=1516159 RepID=UPI0022834390|nr:hypothetical protein [Vibrio coralliirubri]MCY9866478.1 hypothetical protein [Vibrio coralliirubri]